MVMNLFESQRLSSSPGLLKALTFRGAPTEKTMPGDVKRCFECTQGYGLGETNEVAVSVHRAIGKDYLCRLEST